MPSASQQRKTALAIVDAFNRMDTQTIFSVRSTRCVREILPRSLGHAAQDSAAFQRNLNMMRAVFKTYSLQVHDLVEDAAQRKVVLWLEARADTVVGRAEYVCEYVLSLEFDESGKTVVAWKEFVDASANTDYLVLD
ncbi:hypothetical protein K490DRAFT_62783 [Saccharata proteae CBS 121410]|uniref:SnoaL-like domain-containing protein n=1 Tax=Saccharata proteae CBS 121410 TaxID=1314787 RepID=A0A9P4LWT6_9PEZI|nr:hypothetical protein K490DRAFT_62783 [Saccharata proteae CBS 121410]